MSIFTRQKVVSVFFWASKVTFCCTREKAIFSNFGCKTWDFGLRMPKSTDGDHFLSPTIPKNGGFDSCFTWNHFWASFGQKSRILGSFLVDSPLKNLNQKPMVLMVSGWSKNLNWYLGSLYIHRDNRISKAGSQKRIFHFEEHPNEYTG